MTRPATARAAVMVVPGQALEIREYPVAAPPPGGMLVRVRCCTICRSDLHTWTGRRPGPVPCILGHEIVGEVVELGHGVTRDSAQNPLAPGDRVTWTIGSSCGQCFYCREHDLPMKCVALRKYGHDACDQPPHLRGGFAEYCLLDAGTRVVKIPQGIPDTIAAPANCALATIVAGWDAAQLQAGERVLIQGAGALGCYAAAFAAHAGSSRIIVTDVDAERLELARRFGATDCLDVSQLSAAEMAQAVKELTGGFGADCALEVAGVPAVLVQGLTALRVGGRYIEAGCVFPNATLTLDASLLVSRLLTLRGLHNYDARHLRRAVEFLAAARHQFPFELLVSRVFAFADINAALQAAEAREALRVAISMV